MLKFGDYCPNSNWYMTQNVKLQGHDLESQGHLWRSTIVCKTSRTLPMSNLPKDGQEKKEERRKKA